VSGRICDYRIRSEKRQVLHNNLLSRMHFLCGFEHIHTACYWDIVCCMPSIFLRYFACLCGMFQIYFASVLSMFVRYFACTLGMFLGYFAGALGMFLRNFVHRLRMCVTYFVWVLGILLAKREPCLMVKSLLTVGPETITFYNVLQLPEHFWPFYFQMCLINSALEYHFHFFRILKILLNEHEINYF